MKIFIDLDSTLNQLMDPWLIAIQRHLGEKIPLETITHWDRLKDERYQSLLCELGFFRHLGVEEGAQQALQMAQSDGHSIYVVSATTKYDYADKVEWLAEYFPLIPRKHFIGASCKAELARHDRLLIDDAPHNLTDWEAAGGIAVAYTQPWNHEWKGLRMHHWYELARILGRTAQSA